MSPNAFRVSLTLITVPLSYSSSRSESVTAPALSADKIKSCPSAFSPFNGIKSTPAADFLESVVMSFISRPFSPHTSAPDVASIISDTDSICIFISSPLIGIRGCTIYTVPFLSYFFFRCLYTSMRSSKSNFSLPIIWYVS